MSQTSLIAVQDYRKLTDEEIFLTRLRGNGFAFLNIDSDYIAQHHFFCFCIARGFLTYLGPKEYMGQVARFGVKEDFIFEMRNFPHIIGERHIHRYIVEANDLVVWSELLLDRGKKETVQRPQSVRGELNLYSIHYVMAWIEQDERDALLGLKFNV